MEENNFSTFIKELRMEKGLSQEELAKALYVHRTTVNKWENDNVIPLNDKLLLIADYFDISVDELLNGKRSDINTASSTRNNTIVELIKSKTKSQKFLIYSVLVTLILILGFLAYYFISNYNSIKLYRVYGANENIRTRDGLLFFSKDKVYFRPGNFYDNNDNIVDVDLIRLYYFDASGDEVILLTGASKNLIVELENSREAFINRLNNGMSLGSDVTTYYAFKVDMGDRDLTAKELNTENPYNTRATNMVGKLPVGPICNPSKEAIEAVFNYKETDALYFVADKNGKVYFTKTNEEHNKMIKTLKSEGLWFTY